MNENRHATLIAQYAQDWIEIDKPWERWEWRPKEGYPEWRSVMKNSVWYADALIKKVEESE